MSRVEYASKPVPVLTKLVLVLRHVPAIKFVLARFAALLRRDQRSSELLDGKLPGEIPGVIGSPDRHLAVSEPPCGQAIVTPASDGRSEREKLIHRRWTETGIKMWNPNFHGAGLAALNIQGGVELLPVKPGETLPGYDKLEFRLIEGLIACEGIFVDPPMNRK
jgi:hypothetical protein